MRCKLTKIHDGFLLQNVFTKFDQSKHICDTKISYDDGKEEVENSEEFNNLDAYTKSKIEKIINNISNDREICKIIKENEPIAEFEKKTAINSKKVVRYLS